MKKKETLPWENSKKVNKYALITFENGQRTFVCFETEADIDVAACRMKSITIVNESAARKVQKEIHYWHYGVHNVKELNKQEII